MLGLEYAARSFGITRQSSIAPISILWGLHYQAQKDYLFGIYDDRYGQVRVGWANATGNHDPLLFAFIIRYLVRRGF